SPRDGGLIRRGSDAELDELFKVAKEGKDWLIDYQAKEITRTGINSLKVGYNQVHGYYIEVTHAHTAKIPANYSRRQTLRKEEGSTTRDLKESEEKVPVQADRLNQREYGMFLALVDQVAAKTHRLLQTAEVLATLDVLAGLAELAVARQYTRPELCPEPVL